MKATWTKFFARLLCVLLTLQGYPLMALQESGVRAEPVVPAFVDELGRTRTAEASVDP